MNEGSEIRGIIAPSCGAPERLRIEKRRQALFQQTIPKSRGVASNRCGHVILGTHIYPAKGEAAERQSRALDTWRSLPDCQLVNLQFTRNWPILELDGFATSITLKQDSNQLCRCAGVRKPSVKEMLCRLAETADAADATYFGLVNADILLDPGIVPMVKASGKTAVMFSRREVDPDGPKEVLTWGVDAVFFRCDWWKAHQRRFRAYILGEAFWDVVVTSIALSHGDGQLVNDGLCLQHVRHPIMWEGSPFAYHNHYLSRLDSPYFTCWLNYHNALQAARRTGASREEEYALQEEYFKRRQPPDHGLYHWARCAWFSMRYHRQKWCGTW